MNTWDDDVYRFEQREHARELDDAERRGAEVGIATLDRARTLARADFARELLALYERGLVDTMVHRCREVANADK